LEDFGFQLKVRECPPIRIDYYGGRDLYGTSNPINGISFLRYNSSTELYDTVHVSCDEYAQAGIRIQNVADVMANLEAVLTDLKSRPASVGEARLSRPKTHLDDIRMDPASEG
jgi:hypothetical protein